MGEGLKRAFAAAKATRAPKPKASEIEAVAKALHRGYSAHAVKLGGYPPKPWKQQPPKVHDNYRAAARAAIRALDAARRSKRK